MPSYCLVLFIFYLVVASVSASQSNQATAQNAPKVDGKIFDANHIEMPVKNDGNFADLYVENNYAIGNGLYFQDTKLIYASGFWLAAQVDDLARAAIALFGGSDFTPGMIDANGVHFGEQDSVTFRVYKIQRGDTPTSNPDYAEWPATFGAPVDENGKPLIWGDQTLWCSFSDAYLPGRHYNSALPLGAEIHLMVWGWQYLDNVVFLRWNIINKSQKHWKNAYVGIVVDPDMADPYNDGIASDSTLNMVFCYEFKKDYYEVTHQAVGYMFLQTPIEPSPGDNAITLTGWRPGFVNVPAASARIYKHNPKEWTENMFSPGSETKTYVYYRLTCRDKFGTPMIDPITGRRSQWAFSGDPITQAGWQDDALGQDRRMMISSGPFNLAPGDTNSVILAIIARQSDNRHQNIIDLKRDAKLLRSSFEHQFKVFANAFVKIDSAAADARSIYIQAPISCENGVAYVQASFYSQQGELAGTAELFDDGNHFDQGTGDQVYGNVWETSVEQDMLSMNLVIMDHRGRQYEFKNIIADIILRNRLTITGAIVADHLNCNGKVNPGENVRMTLSIRNHYDVPLHRLGLLALSQDSLIHIDTRSLVVDSLAPNSERQSHYNPLLQTGYFEFNVPEIYPLHHNILIQIESYDEFYRHWTNWIEVPVQPFEFAPEELTPVQISGTGDAAFIIRIINPRGLKKHNYEIVVVDSINPSQEKGFTLIDQTWGVTLLSNYPAPDQYAYNIPITDGFKIAHAYLPKGGLKRVNFIEAAHGHPQAFHTNKSNSFVLGGVPYFDFYKTIEIEFTDPIDKNGVVGAPTGQKAYRYDEPGSKIPTGFYSCPFYVWKYVDGKRAGLLDVCFTEYPIFPTNNNQWGPNTSLIGGFEPLYIMKTDYDESGTTFQNMPLRNENIFYKIRFELLSDTSIIDPGDKFVIEFERPATSRDRFAFIPTDVDLDEDSNSPHTFTLFQNYPNPFNQFTTIRFSIDQPTEVSLKIYNILGQVVRELTNERLKAGDYSFRWDGANELGQQVGSGLYFARLCDSRHNRIIKMMVIR